MGSYQIWPCHVTQAENLSFPYLKSYCPLNFRKSHQISWFCYIPNGSYKEDNLKEGRICPPPKCGIGLNNDPYLGGSSSGTSQILFAISVLEAGICKLNLAVCLKILKCVQRRSDIAGNCIITKASLLYHICKEKQISKRELFFVSREELIAVIVLEF